MRVGMFSPYLDTMGGGERYFITAARYFLERGDDVDIFWRENIVKKVQERFGINLEGVGFKQGFKTFGYDLIFFLSDGSLPLSFAKKNIIHFQVPFTRASHDLLTKIKLINSVVVCNSKFTKAHIDKAFEIDSKVIYPPVDVDNFRIGKKENIIVSVGRFFAPMHPKKQELMVEKFLEMKPKGWELILIGGVTGSQSLKSVEELRKKVGRGDNIKIITDASFERLKEYYSKAKIFWHAAGFGEDLKNHPERGEHFGMTTVEAMAAGCVPVCFAGGGQTEIIDNGLNGYLWRDVDGLREATIRLITEDKLRRKMLVEAIGKSAQFSVKRFYLALEAIV